MVDDQTLVPNIFQLASGELSLLSLFLSIVRDFDLSDENLTTSESIKGIVIVDEIEAHLSVDHAARNFAADDQIVPERSQFRVVTTHSPLFALGMEREFGVDGFQTVPDAGWDITSALRSSASLKEPTKFSRDTAAFSTDVLSRYQAIPEGYRVC